MSSTQDLLATALAFPLTIAFLAVVMFAMAWPFEMVWNYVVPAIFGAPTLDYWHAWAGLVLLSYFKPSTGGGSK